MNIGKLVCLCVVLMCSMSFAKEDEEVVKEQTFYHQLGKPLVVNLARIAGGDNPGLIQVGVQIMVKGENDVEIVKRHSLYLRNDLILLLSSKTKEQLGRSEARELLRRQALDIIRKRIAKQEGKSANVVKVLFTQMIIE